MISFSKILLNPQTRGGRRLLTDPQAMHAAVLSCFPPDLDTSTARVLWRVDHHGHEHTLYMVGPEEPNCSVIVDQAGWAARPGQVADYGPLLDSVMTGQERSFRLTANPVRALPANGSKRGQVVPHVTPAQQVSWLLSKAHSAGFEIRDAAPSVDGAPGSGGPDVVVTARRDLDFGRRESDSGRRGRVALRTAQFDGTLRITDAGAFRSALTFGIGRGKAYGCGLLTVARLGEA